MLLGAKGVLVLYGARLTCFNAADILETDWQSEFVDGFNSIQREAEPIQAIRNVNVCGSAR